MNRSMKIYVVSLLTGLSLGQGASPPPASAATRYTGPITVNRHDYTADYVAAYRACTKGDTSWDRTHYCDQVTPDNGERCLRVEVWFDTTPETHMTLRDDCGWR